MAGPALLSSTKAIVAAWPSAAVVPQGACGWLSPVVGSFALLIFVSPSTPALLLLVVMAVMCVPTCLRVCVCVCACVFVSE